jgi:hypothetical protein
VVKFYVMCDPGELRSAPPDSIWFSRVWGGADLDAANRIRLCRPLQDIRLCRIKLNFEGDLVLVFPTAQYVNDERARRRNCGGMRRTNLVCILSSLTSIVATIHGRSVLVSYIAPLLNLFLVLLSRFIGGEIPLLLLRLAPLLNVTIYV